MIEQSITRTGTRHHRADRRFLDMFADDFGIRAFWSYSLEGIPKKQAIAVAQWAADHIADEDERGKAVRAYCRKRKIGDFDRRLIDEPAPTYGGHELEGV